MDKKKLDDAKAGIDFLQKIGAAGRKIVGESGYYHIVWGSVIGIAASVDIFYKSPWTWLIASLVGFFLTTTLYAGILVSIIVWGILAGINIGIIFLNIKWLFILSVSLSVPLGFMLTGTFSKKTREKHISVGPIGLKFGISWAAIILVAYLLCFTFAKTGSDWGIIIMSLVGIGYIITGLFSTYEISIWGVLIILLTFLLYSLLPSHFYLFYIFFGVISIILGIYLKKRYGRT